MDAPSRPAKEKQSFEARIQALLATPAKRQDFDTRKTLICASQLEEWLTVGFNEANISRVADRAGVSTATLYRLYPDRNQLFLDTLEMGNQIILDAVRQAPTHPHPFRNLVELTHQIAWLWQQPSVQLFLDTQGYLLQTETEITKGAKQIAATFSQKFRQFCFATFDKLVELGFIEDCDRFDMFHRLTGPIEAKTLEWHARLKMQFQPAEGWYEEAVKITEHFFIVYGSGKYKAIQQQGQLARLDAQSLSRTQLKTLDQASLQSLMDKFLPFLKDLEDSLRNKPVPESTDAFIWQELQRLMTKSNNRLDASNRRNRIVAAAMLVNYSQGHRNINMAAIAKQAGVSTATLYRLYPNDYLLYNASTGLGSSFYMAWLAKEFYTSNPLLRLSKINEAFIHTFLDPRFKNARSMGGLIENELKVDTPISTGELIVHYTDFHWHQRLSKLLEEGFIQEEPSWDMIHALNGPTTSICGLSLRFGVDVQPKGSWFAECRTIVDEFFQIYGTPHFHAMRKKMNWDQELDALCAAQA